MPCAGDDDRGERGVGPRWEHGGVSEFQGAGAPDASAEFVPPAVLDPAATLAPLRHGPRDPTLRLVPDGVWRAVRLASGPALVRLGWRRARRPATQEASPLDRRSGGTTRGTILDPARGDRVRIEAWGPGAREAAAGVPAWLGALDDWSGFDAPAFAARLPDTVAATRRVRPGLRLPSGGSLFDTLTAIILEQRVTGIEAHYAWARLVTRFGEAAPGPAPATTTAAGREARLMLPPTPEQWRRIPSWEWHQARVDAQRRTTIVRAAERASALARLEAQVPAAAAAAELARLDIALRSLPGVGVWSAAETLQRTHGAPDHVSFGDFHVAHFVGQALMGRRADDAGMEALLAPFAGHRQRVVRLLQASGAKNPSFGPRLAPQDHRGH
ncbi:3-methyladenine DNA glycosylase [Galactobacter valiniphilus]|uniref:3-methyladenine DNA glycosylase n=1 Tax=Galactobacter valiniphilus TaxID=2676122 RepID=A0A399JEM6_9MICC|nr:3-methyladenine DNA glycosylase [Galactobacter valiniphilus]